MRTIKVEESCVCNAFKLAAADAVNCIPTMIGSVKFQLLQSCHARRHGAAQRQWTIA